MADNTGVAGFNNEIEQALQKAWHSEKGGDSNWYAFMQAYDVNPLTEQEREMLLNSEMKIAKGAFPIELRRVFEKILTKHGTSGDQNVQNAVNSFNMETKVMDYYKKIKPFGGMSDIFSNAATTMNKYSEGMQKAKQSTMKCKNCGSPRLEEMQYDSCLFCGSKLFENNN